MKIKLFFSALLLFVGMSVSNAQYVNNVAIKDLDADYIVLWSDNGPLLSSKITVRIDYGQGGRTPQVQDDRRKVISFNGMVDVINIMSRSGFELDRIHRNTKGDNDYFYFKRRNIPGVAFSYEDTTDYK